MDGTQQTNQALNTSSFYKNKWFIIGVSGLLIIVIIVAVILAMNSNRNKTNNNSNNQNNSELTPTPTTTITPTNTPETSQLIWQQTQNGWIAMQTPPVCSDSRMITLPADISKVTSVLYPGQTRGGNYKPHGGLRFDNNTDNNIAVTAPFDGFIVKGGHFLAEGEIQYYFDVMNNCGVMYRIGHLREIPSDLLQLTTSWPQPIEGDSRSNNVNPAVFIEKGHVLANAVGIIKDKNVFFDFGVYDYRSQNEASQSLAFQQQHSQDKELSWYAVCWFSWLDASTETKIRSLPAGDPQSGKKSDYCK